MTREDVSTATVLLPRDTVGAFVEAPQVLVAPSAAGVLDGCRVAVKDVIDVVGTVTGAGNPQFAADHAVADRSAAAVEMLTAAGATVVGKTVTDELAYSLAGRNVHDGAPLNVSALGRVTGGSSAGSAAAVAAGLVELGLGTDTGGSIRVPASYCGLYGFRPTQGAVDDRGIVHLARSFDTVGVLTRSATLLAAAVDVLLRGAGSPIAPDDVSATYVEELLDVVGTDTRAAIMEFVDAPMTTIGLDPPAAAAAFVKLQGREAWREHGDWIETGHPVFAPDVAARFEAASRVTDEEVARAIPVRESVRTALVDATAGGAVVLLAPATLGGAPLVDESGDAQTETRARLLSLTTPASLAGCPVVVVPGARDPDGLPVGIACLGAPGHDRAVVRFAARLAGG